MNYITTIRNTTTSDVSQRGSETAILRLELSRFERGSETGWGGSTTALQLAGCQWLIVLLLLLSAVSVSAAAAAASSLGFWISVSSESYFSCAIAACHLVASPAAFPFHCTEKLLQQREGE